MTASVDHTRTSTFDVRLDLRRREVVVGEDVARNQLVLGHRDLIPDPQVREEQGVGRLGVNASTVRADSVGLYCASSEASTVVRERP
jgi:hypothetical protein